jgi:hypothetical protein
MKTSNLMSAAAGIALAAAAQLRSGKIYGYENIRRHLQTHKPDHARGGNSIAKLNRHTGQPHEHKREIQRRLRQQAARDARTSA